jgi:hypothetical protein
MNGGRSALDPRDQDVRLLDGAARSLDQHNGANLALPSAGTEFLLYATARLLEAVAESARRGEPLPDEVRQGALRIARHVEHHIHDYLPIQGR